MGIASGVGSLLSAPAKGLNDWASQPLKAFEANRSLKDQDKAVERKIKKETSLSELRRAEAAAIPEFKRFNIIESEIRNVI